MPARRSVPDGSMPASWDCAFRRPVVVSSVRRRRPRLASVDGGAPGGAILQPAIVELGRLPALRPRQRQAGGDGERTGDRGCRRSTHRERAAGCRRGPRCAAGARLYRSRTIGRPWTSRDDEVRFAPITNLVYVNGIDSRHRYLRLRAAIDRRDRPAGVWRVPASATFDNLRGTSRDRSDCRSGSISTTGEGRMGHRLPRRPPPEIRTPWTL